MEFISLLILPIKIYSIKLSYNYRYTYITRCNINKVLIYLIHFQIGNLALCQLWAAMSAVSTGGPSLCQTSKQSFFQYSFHFFLTIFAGRLEIKYAQFHSTIIKRFALLNDELVGDDVYLTYFSYRTAIIEIRKQVFEF